MWAQLVKMRVKAGSDERLQQAETQWEDEIGRGTDSGWVRTLSFRSTNAPHEYYELVFFESKDKARANERSAEHQRVVQQLMSLTEDEPTYVDLTPVRERTR